MEYEAALQSYQEKNVSVMLIILAPECNLVQYFLWQNPEPVLRSCEL